MSDVRRSVDDASTWESDAASAYALAKHGPDGAKFLDPDLYRLMSEIRLSGTRFLDIAAGAGPWTIHALQKGVTSATALDLSSAMLERARKCLSDMEALWGNVTLIEGSVDNLPFDDDVFDRLASINVGCNLPDGTFQAHFKEALRVAQKGARFLVTAPDSLLVPFTRDVDVVDIQAEIDRRWMLGERAVKGLIHSFASVLRATFVLDGDGKPVLVTEENKCLVRPGTPIIRRIPGLAVDNNFHTAAGYIEAAERAGWTVVEANRNSFRAESERATYNTGVAENMKLGPEYVANPSFLIMDLEKTK